jgi:acyl-CoA synthetase (AMP-forming)/AMP-acid ligase II
MADSKHAVWGDIVRANAAAHRDKPALVCEGRALSFAQFEARTNRLNNALAALGLVKGDRVAILSRNRVEAVEAYGVAGAGLIALPLNWRLSARELLHPLQDGAPRALIAEAEFLPLIESLRPQLGGIEHFIAFDGARAGWLDYEALLDNASAQAPRVEVRPADVACLMYTSGTTGAPKGAMLTHGALVRNARTAAEDLLHLTPEDVVLAVTPLFHVGGMWYHLFPSFAAGCSTVLMKGFEPRAVIDALQRHRASCVHLVPTMIHAVIEQPDAARLDFDHLRLMYYAASPIPPELLRRAMKVFSKSGFVQSYGSTEAGIVTGLTPEDHLEALREPHAAARLASCGRAVGNIGLRVVDGDARPVAPGVIGEVQVKSDRSMAGYWNNPAATRAAMADGWFATGDLGRMDADGYVTLVDRKHDMIVSGGENVYPVEVEAVLYRDPRILEAAVFGMPDARWVEKVAAAIVLRPGVQATADDIIARARGELAGYKCPKTVIFTERLPRNATGKVLKNELRRAYGATPSMQANRES